jgi:hypothetical protein
MATTTPNYGWAVPTSTDLVKDGATAIETLGDAIDASMNTALGTKKAGMVLLNTTSFSGVSSQSVSSVFSSTYDNYRIIISASGGTTTSIRMRATSTDASGTDYNFQRGFYSRSTTIDALRLTGQTSMQVGYLGGNISIDLFSPFLAANTTFNSLNFWTDSTASATSYFGSHNLATSYNGFTLIGSDLLTGTLSVYGYNK